MCESRGEGGGAEASTPAGTWTRRHYSSSLDTLALSVSLPHRLIPGSGEFGHTVHLTFTLSLGFYNPFIIY